MMLKLRGKWITSRFKEGIREAHTADDMRIYAMTRQLGITRTTYDSIDWTTIGRVQSRYKVPWQV